MPPLLSHITTLYPALLASQFPFATIQATCLESRLFPFLSLPSCLSCENIQHNHRPSLKKLCTVHSLPLPLCPTRNTSTSQMGSPYSLLPSCLSEVCEMTMRAVRKTSLMSKDTGVLSWGEEGGFNFAKKRSNQPPETFPI